MASGCGRARDSDTRRTERADTEGTRSTDSLTSNRDQFQMYDVNPSVRPKETITPLIAVPARSVGPPLQFLAIDGRQAVRAPPAKVVEVRNVRCHEPATRWQLRLRSHEGATHARIPSDEAARLPTRCRRAPLARNSSAGSCGELATLQPRRPCRKSRRRTGQWRARDAGLCGVLMDVDTAGAGHTQGRATTSSGGFSS
ncbi:hypothetical protein EJ04DRAFT_14971 [Polyplosphaeria fusca]|uniref:Uncharacterized protein n=1 Tax=Polyplosphaeria fusca TaxID=682080 RepID=A0A9P4QR58_9PLEO|nr:hypothetical protein EJ04DRAFT_14971 [Polyplosphaeria fusca]